MILFTYLNKTILNLSRRKKQAVLILLDCFTLLICQWIAIYLRLGEIHYTDIVELLPISIILVGICIAIFWFLGFYKALIRSMGISNLNMLGVGSIFSGLSFAAVTYFFPDISIPRSVPIIYTILVFLSVGNVRVLARKYFEISTSMGKEKTPLLIYGAGETGNELAAILSGSKDFKVVGFIDDDAQLIGKTMRGKRIFKITDVQELTQRHDGLKVLMSVVNLSSVQKRTVYESLSPLGVEVIISPPIHDVIIGRASIDESRQIKMTDLLGREPVPALPDLFSEAIQGKTFFITGGGGSIGSEICRQIVLNQPARLAILELNEFSLYRIERELKELVKLSGFDIQMDFFLGSVDNRGLITQILKQVEPDYVYHAAAFKHVPLVEMNVLEAIRNNVLGTQVIAQACLDLGVSRMTLVSTDKAVRPESVMGATKRVAELILQSISDNSDSTVFSMVRFGNVLGSSGSVVPLFQEQIANGGPVTVTDPEVTRYFMTILEASQLVIQASFMAEGGEVFVLNMGEPVLIRELARIAILLSGKQVKDADNPEGDIEIQYVGLRPGEKLYEEMLVDDNAQSTRHPKIQKAAENFIAKKELDAHMKVFNKAIEKSDIDKAIATLIKMVEGYQPKRALN